MSYQYSQFVFAMISACGNVLKPYDDASFVTNVANFIIADARKRDKNLRGLMILFDELKLMEVENHSEFLKQFLAALDASERESLSLHLRLVTTLDFFVVEQIPELSKRQIFWGDLTPINVDHLDRYKNLGRLPRAWLQIFFDCGGHPRTIEYAFEYIEKQSQTWKQAKYDQVVAWIVATMAALKVSTLPFNKEHLKPIVLKTSLIANEKVDGKLFGNLCMLGIYMNSITNQSQVPFVSTIHLHNLVKQNDNSNELKLLREMLSLETNIHPRNFETYCAYHIALVRQLSGASQTTIKQAFPGVYNPKWQGSTRMLSFAHHASWTVRQEEHWFKTLANRGDFRLNDCQVVVGCENQPGCDSLFKDSNGFYVGIENKLSEQKNAHDQLGNVVVDKTKSTLTIDQINSKWNLFTQEMEAILESSKVKSPKQDSYCLVFVARQTCSVNPNDLPEGVIIIDARSFQLYFGPTLSQRPFFYKSLLENLDESS